jgi:hypothetical protein
MAIGWAHKSEDFVVDVDNFDDLEINQSGDSKFWWFYLKNERRLIKQFVLKRGPKVDHLCHVALIKTGDKFTPRLAFSARNNAKKIETAQVSSPTNLKASVNLLDCHEQFWKLMSFLQSLAAIEIPNESFSLVSRAQSQIVAALKKRGLESVTSIIRELSAVPGVNLTEQDINSLLKRKEKLAVFEEALQQHASDERWWQDFFETNKWIFGYGLNYVILRQEQAQPHYGGARVDGKGGQRGDLLMSTMGDLNFTVLVEIKTPSTPLLRGKEEIRTGAWSLSRELTDALAQIQANVQTWEETSRNRNNSYVLEKKGVYTVEPKGIIVIGMLSELKLGDVPSRRETFQRFRRSIHGIEVISFDELLIRARFITRNDSD